MSTQQLSIAIAGAGGAAALERLMEELPENRANIWEEDDDPHMPE